MTDRPGIKTTEFWLALVVTVLSASAAVYAESDLAKLGGLIGAALTAAGYGFVRARVKTNPKGSTVGTATQWSGQPPLTADPAVQALLRRFGDRPISLADPSSTQRIERDGGGSDNDPTGAPA